MSDSKIKNILTNFLGILDIEIFEDKYFYWRQFARNDFYMPLQSYLFMDCLEESEDQGLLDIWKKRSMKLELHIFNGLYPHRSKIEVDPVGEQIACFIDYNRIAVMPLLHSNDIKL